MMCETHSRRGAQIERALFLKSLSHIHIYISVKCTKGKIVSCSSDVSFKRSSCHLKENDLVAQTDQMYPCQNSCFVWIRGLKINSDSCDCHTTRPPSGHQAVFVGELRITILSSVLFIFIKYMICKQFPNFNNSYQDFKIQHNLQ